MCATKWCIGRSPPNRQTATDKDRDRATEKRRAEERQRAAAMQNGFVVSTYRHERFYWCAVHSVRTGLVRMAASCAQSWWHVWFSVAAVAHLLTESVVCHQMSLFCRVIVARRADFFDWPMVMWIAYHPRHPDDAKRNCRSFGGEAFVSPFRNCGTRRTICWASGEVFTFFFSSLTLYHRPFAWYHVACHWRRRQASMVNLTMARPIHSDRTHQRPEMTCVTKLGLMWPFHGDALANAKNSMQTVCYASRQGLMFVYAHLLAIVVIVHALSSI